MADTPWTGFADAAALEPTDIGLIQRGAGGLNFTADMLVHRRADGNYYSDGPIFVNVGDGITLGDIAGRARLKHAAGVFSLLNSGNNPATFAPGRIDIDLGSDHGTYLNGIRVMRPGVPTVFGYLGAVAGSDMVVVGGNYPGTHGRVGFATRDGTTEIIRAILDSAKLAPNSNGIYDLGGSSARWQAFYGVSANLSGRVTSTMAGSAGNPNFYAVSGGVEFVAAADPGNGIVVLGSYTLSDVVMVRGTTEKARLTSGGVSVSGTVNTTIAFGSSQGFTCTDGTRTVWLTASSGATGLPTTGTLTDHDFEITRSGSVILKVQSGGFRPGADNAFDLGSASLRWGTVFAATGTINTSDARDKTKRGDGTPTEAERKWARSIAAVCYQLNESIAEKGAEAARLHWGAEAQQVYEAGVAAGIDDPFRYGFVGKDALTRIEKRPVAITRQKVEIVTEAVREVEFREGKHIIVEREIERQQPVFEEVPLFDEAGAAVMIERPKIEIREEQAIEVQDGKAVIVTRQVETPVTEAVPVFDGDGKAVMIEIEDPEPSPISGPNGEPIRRTIEVAATHQVPVMEQLQATQRVPVMEAVEVEQDVEVPILDGDDQPIERWNLRYTELIMFMLACDRADRMAES